WLTADLGVRLDQPRRRPADRGDGGVHPAAAVAADERADPWPDTDPAAEPDAATAAGGQRAAGVYDRPRQHQGGLQYRHPAARWRGGVPAGGESNDGLDVRAALHHRPGP